MFIKPKHTRHQHQQTVTSGTTQPAVTLHSQPQHRGPAVFTACIYHIAPPTELRKTSPGPRSMKLSPPAPALAA